MLLSRRPATAAPSRDCLVRGWKGEGRSVRVCVGMSVYVEICMYVGGCGNVYVCVGDVCMERKKEE